MRSQLTALIVVTALAAAMLLEASPALAARTESEYVAEAQALAGGGKLAEAVALLQEGAKEHPGSVEIYAYLGLFTGQSAGQAANYVEAGRPVTESFALFDKAVELGPENPIGYFYRGVMSVKVPVFLGKLPGGINDLKTVIAMGEKSKGAGPQDMLMPADSMRGR